MVDLKKVEYYEKEMARTITQGTIDECGKMIASQQEYIRSLISENEKLRECILDNLLTDKAGESGRKGI